MFFRIKRPLFTAAVLLLALMALLLYFHRGFSDKSTLNLMSEDGSCISISGTVVSADSKYIYLGKLSFIPSSENISSSLGRSIMLKKNIKIMLSKDSISESGISGDLSIGNRISVYGTFRIFSSASNPGEFDAKAYYESLNICGKITPSDLSVTGMEKSYPAEIFYRVRLFLGQRIDAVFPEKEASVIKDLLLGDKAGLDPDIKALYQRNGIAHILSVSSLHISLLGYGLFRLLRKLGTGRRVSAAVSTAVLICYGMLTGPSTSAVRAISIFAIAMGANIFRRTTDSLTSLSMAALILMISNPQCIRSCSFLLSFGSALGIYVFYPAMKKILLPSDLKIHRYEEKNKKTRIKKIVSDFIKGMGNSLLTSLSITLTTLPVQLYFFYEIPTYSVLINLAVLPFLSCLMISSFIALFPPLQIPAAFISCLILKWYEYLCGIFDRLPGSGWNPGCPPAYVIIIYYIFWIAFVAASRFMKKEAVIPDFFKRRRLFKKRPGIASKPALRILSALCTVFLMILLCMPHLKPGTAVFLDVGQGDCILVYTEGREVYVFDGGSTSRTDVGKYVIKPVLKYYGFSTIDAVFISHTDSDHYNGIEEILENEDDWNIDIKRLYFPDTDGLSEESGYLTLLNSTGYATPNETSESSAGYAGEDIYVGFVSRGDCWQSGSTTFTCLHPPEGYCSEDINESSACFYVTFGSGSSSLLLCGDITGDGEERLTEALASFPPVTVLKVAHHGSRNSTSELFLNTVNASAAVISAGRNNRYGHPHAETLERLNEINCKIYTTAERGAITVFFNKRKNQAKISYFIGGS